jgi:hypothetical protein
MARTVTLNGQTVKVRHPLAPLGLGIITLGIYTLVWYYLINDEMRRQGEDVSPGVALLAITLGIFLIIPPFVSIYNTAERIRRTQERNGVTDPISPVLALILLFIPIVSAFQTAYLQAGLNRAWERAGGDFAAPAAGPTAASEASPAADTTEMPPVEFNGDVGQRFAESRLIDAQRLKDETSELGPDEVATPSETLL